MNKTKRLVQGALLVSAITLTVTACGQKMQLTGAATTTPETTATPIATTPIQTVTPKPSVAPLKQLQVKAYYSDQDEMKLVEKVVTVRVEKDSEAYEAALKALQKSEDPKAIPLFEDMKFNSVKWDAAKGEIKLDMTFGPKTQLGAPGEELFLQALKKTMFQFPEVKTLYVLKDGKQVDSLMGHVELPYPIKRPTN
ncbi:GerMN domain-containing protein [Paenibacillus oryzisoli]|uniref:GerMN domain-containing protein n=1 Tax=Paenibacillus oryzisoli TaxID=1850517 RepID=A0A197ZXU8_9BACL|nr:GerMN domain-containing protein [Paenibacillus oryzisoli]OAS13999.1 hypothetical protein A8708_11545 [Paenibacillus oryzisoli]